MGNRLIDIKHDFVIFSTYFYDVIYLVAIQNFVLSAYLAGSHSEILKATWLMYIPVAKKWQSVTTTSIAHEEYSNPSVWNLCCHGKTLEE
jgi:hypothetical protein